MAYQKMNKDLSVAGQLQPGELAALHGKRVFAALSATARMAKRRTSPASAQIEAAGAALAHAGALLARRAGGNQR